MILNAAYSQILTDTTLDCFTDDLTSLGAVCVQTHGHGKRGGKDSIKYLIIVPSCLVFSPVTQNVNNFISLRVYPALVTK